MGIRWRVMFGFAALGACAGARPIATPVTPPATVTVPLPATPSPPRPLQISDEARTRAIGRLEQRIARVGSTYVLAPALIKLDLTIDAAATVACSVEVSVSPPTDSGEERWEGGRTAIATGRAHVTSTASPHEVELSVDACIDSATEQVVLRRVVPFLQRSVAAR